MKTSITRALAWVRLFKMLHDTVAFPPPVRRSQKITFPVEIVRLSLAIIIIIIIIEKYVHIGHPFAGVFRGFRRDRFACRRSFAPGRHS